MPAQILLRMVTLGFLSFCIGFGAHSPLHAQSAPPQSAPPQSAPPQAELSTADKVVIESSFQLWKRFGEELWPGWTQIAIPMVYITEGHEFAIGFEQSPAGFETFGWQANGLPTYFRARQLNPNLAASFPFQGIPCVVIGTPGSLKSSPTKWTLTAVHEMFHVLQMQRGSFAKVASLKIVEGENDGSWQLNFPFPYDQSNVMRLLHLEGYPLFLAVEDSDSENEVRYNIGTSVDATQVMKAFLNHETGNDRAFNYARFQQWKEGIARYTEYKFAELAADQNYQPSEEMRLLDDFEPYPLVWQRDYQDQVNLFKHAGRVARSRSEFYNLGLAKGLALDRAKIDWRDAYFSPNVWLDDLLEKAAGTTAIQSATPTGARAPNFQLRSFEGTEFQLSDHANQLVLLDFWQPWCPPCVEALPSLAALQSQFPDLEVVGIVDRSTNPSEIAAIEKKYSVNWTTLNDSEGQTASEYAIQGYPHLTLIHKQKIIWQHHGKLDESKLAELKQILEDQTTKLKSPN